MAKGAAWMVSLRFVDRIIGFVSTLILARLLLPEDFGLVAMSTVLLHFLMSISDFSVHVRLIQKHEIDESDLNGAWSMQVVLGIGQCILVSLLAIPVSAFYEESRLLPVIYILAFIALIKGVKNIGVVMFQREMAFHKEFVMMLIVRVSAFCTTIALALALRSYWALIAGMVVQAIIEVSLSYVMHPYRPRLSTSRWAELFGFSKWLLMSNTLGFLGQRSADIMLGRLSGPRAVGLFSMGYEIGLLATSELVAPINRAALPGYSRLRESEGALKKGYIDVLGLIAIGAMPAAAGIAAGAAVFVPLLLGDKWDDAIPVVHYLALTGTIGCLMTNNAAVYSALGVPKLTTFLLAGRLILLIPAILIGAGYYGVAGAAFAYLIVELTILLANLAVILRVLSITLTEYLNAVYRPVLGVTAMYAMLVTIVVPWLSIESGLNQLSVALATIVAGALVYILIIVGTWVIAGRPTGAETTVMRIVTEVLQRTRILRS